MFRTVFGGQIQRLHAAAVDQLPGPRRSRLPPSHGASSVLLPLDDHGPRRHGFRSEASTTGGSASSDGDSVTVPVDPRRLVKAVFVACIAAELLFVLLDYHVNFGRLVDIGAVRRFANIAREDSLASWFGTTQTALVALTLWMLYLAARFQDVRRSKRWGWLALALFFTYMAVDDGAQIHERLGTVYSEIQEQAASGATSVFPSYMWQVLFIPPFAACGLGMLVFLWRELPLRPQRLLVVLALGCLVTAVGLDFIEGLDPSHAWNLHSILSQDSPALEAWTLQRFGQGAFVTLDHFGRSLEECLEMVANTLLWVVFLQHLALSTGEMRFRFSLDR